eukprot:647643-Pleurochrysis_carterae.AAC.1
MQKFLKVFLKKPQPMSKSHLMYEEQERPVVTPLSNKKKTKIPQGNLTEPLLPPSHTGGQRIYQTAHGRNGGKETLINNNSHGAGSMSHVVFENTKKLENPQPSPRVSSKASNRASDKTPNGASARASGKTPNG